ncbi:MAG: extracellular solute-binding protein [Dehalococcoidia bacterium]|nr:extracellular solute-binding protein [Dehalococcoidia bacterium]
MIGQLPARWHRAGLIAFALVAAVFAIACTDDADGGDNGAATPTTDPTAAGDSTAAGDATATATVDPTASGGTPVEGGAGVVTVYSGRSQDLIGPILDTFQQETAIEVEVRYGDTAEMAALLLEEGDRGPADVYIAQDAGALGAVESAGLFADLDPALLDLVPEAYRSPAGQWVGLSGRARVVAYNTEALEEADLPDSILDFTDPQWDGRLGWAPTNGSFQAFVTALRLTEGEDGAREWLEGIVANNPTEYPNNTSIVQAAADGEIDAGFVNHYYLHRFLAEQGEDFGARNHYTGPGDPGTLINVAGAGILSAADSPDEAQQLLEFLLGDEAQSYFTEQTFEYPVVESVEANLDLQSLSELQPVELDLGQLDDLQGTLDLLRETGILP